MCSEIVEHSLLLATKQSRKHQRARNVHIFVGAVLQYSNVLQLSFVDSPCWPSSRELDMFSVVFISDSARRF